MLQERGRLMSNQPQSFQPSPLRSKSKQKIFDSAILPTSFKPYIQLGSVKNRDQKVQDYEFSHDESLSISHLQIVQGDVNRSHVQEIKVEQLKQEIKVSKEVQTEIKSDEISEKDKRILQLLDLLKLKDDQIVSLQNEMEKMKQELAQNQPIQTEVKENQEVVYDEYNPDMEFSFYGKCNQSAPQYNEQTLQDISHVLTQQQGQPIYETQNYDLPKFKSGRQNNQYFQVIQNENMYMMKPMIQTHQSSIGPRKSNKEFFSSNSYY